VLDESSISFWRFRLVCLIFVSVKSRTRLYVGVGSSLSFSQMERDKPGPSQVYSFPLALPSYRPPSPDIKAGFTFLDSFSFLGGRGSCPASCSSPPPTQALQKVISSQLLGAEAYIPSYLGSWNCENRGSRPALVNKRPYLQNYHSKMNWKCGSSNRTPVLQVWNPKFKPQLHKKKKEKKKGSNLQILRI
jgi:hypothetical protein